MEWGQLFYDTLAVDGVEGRSLRSLGVFAATNFACYVVIDNKLVFTGGNIKACNKKHLTVRSKS